MVKNRNIGIYPFILIGMLLTITNSCIKYDNNNLIGGQMPVLTTTAISNITQNTASCGGIITSGATVLVRGVCFGTNQTPTIADTKTTDGTGAGGFSSNITGLTASTIYYVRAYASNSAGTAYGSAVSFTTSIDTTATVTDIDGNVYHTVTIGSQVWMEENLKTTKYSDGTSIPNVTDNTSWENLTTGAYCDYDNTPTNSVLYGRLYNWYAVTNAHNIAPTGWHVPTNDEWVTLSAYLGGDSLAGGLLKEIGTTHWAGPNSAATNETGFTALPGGSRNTTYNSLGDYGTWWSATAYDSGSIWLWTLYYGDSYLSSYGNSKAYGFSVRCLRD